MVQSKEMGDMMEIETSGKTWTILYAYQVSRILMLHPSFRVIASGCLADFGKGHFEKNKTAFSLLRIFLQHTMWPRGCWQLTGIFFRDYTGTNTAKLYKQVLTPEYHLSPDRIYKRRDGQRWAVLPSVCESTKKKDDFVFFQLHIEHN